MSKILRERGVYFKDREIAHAVTENLPKQGFEVVVTPEELNSRTLSADDRAMGFRLDIYEILK